MGLNFGRERGLRGYNGNDLQRRTLLVGNIGDRIFVWGLCPLVGRQVLGDIVELGEGNCSQNRISNFLFAIACIWRWVVGCPHKEGLELGRWEGEGGFFWLVE